MEKPEVIDNLQRAMLEIEYAVADFGVWQSVEDAPSPDACELEWILSRTRRIHPRCRHADTRITRRSLRAASLRREWAGVTELRGRHINCAIRLYELTPTHLFA